MISKLFLLRQRSPDQRDPNRAKPGLGSTPASPLTILARPDKALVEAIAASEINWSVADKQAEIERVMTK